MPRPKAIPTSPQEPLLPRSPSSSRPPTPQSAPTKCEASPASAGLTAPAGQPPADRPSARSSAWNAHLKNPRPNPNRRTFLAEGGLEAQYLYNPYNRELTPLQIETLERQGVDQVSIVIQGAEQPKQVRIGTYPAEHLIGISIKQSHRIVYLSYPVQGEIESALPLALELAVLRSPGMSNLRLVTPYKFLWDSANYTELTRQRLMDYGSRLKLGHPLAHDLSNVLARLAASGVTGPKTVDYHIYTSSVSNGERCFTATLLWGERRANFFVQTLPGADLVQAHTNAAQWAFGMVPPQSHMYLINDCRSLNTIWQTAQIEGTDLKQKVKPLIARLGEKKLSFATGSGERYHAPLSAAVRQMAGDLHARAAPDIRPEFLSRPGPAAAAR